MSVKFTLQEAGRGAGDYAPMHEVAWASGTKTFKDS
jgi:hypothetical protein